MRGIFLSALLLAAAVLLSACGGSDQAQVRANVVVILVDTLRADRLSVAGYPKPTSPGLEELAARGVYFERFYTHSAITRPSVATLMTSRYLSGHRVLGHGGYALPDRVPFLPAILADAGYSTAAFVTSPQFHPQLGFSRGFETFVPLYSRDIDPRTRRLGDLVKVPAARAFTELRAYLEATSDKPYFAYVHLQEPHGPYEVDADQVRPFFAGDYDGDVTGSIRDFGRADALGADPVDLEYFRALYDAEVASVDEAIADFVAWTSSRGYLENTHVLVTADHGEELLEHGRLGHSYWIHQELLRIPLLWIGPGVPHGRRVDALAGLVDVVPTLLDVLELEPPAEARFAGRSLRPLWSGRPADDRRGSIFVESVERRWGHDTPPTVARAVVTETHKIIGHHCALDGPECESLQLFSLIDDPEERSGRPLDGDAEGLRPAEAEALRTYLHEVRAALLLQGQDAASQVQLPEEDLEQLRALGYVD